MFTNIKPHGKNIQARCRTNLPKVEDICFKFKFMIINLPLMREGIINLPKVKEYVHVSRTIKGLANPNVLRMRAFGTYTRGLHIKQDNKFKLIMEHKTFIINHKWIMHNYMMLTCFCEIMFVLARRKLICIFHTVGKKPTALLGGPWRRWSR